MNGVQAQKPILPIDELGGASETGEKGGGKKDTHLFCGENRKTDQSSRVSHQSGLYTSSIFWMRKHKLCNARRNRNNE